MTNQQTSQGLKVMRQLLSNQFGNSMAIDKFSQYSQLLLKWNKTYNLTAHNNIEEIINYHLLDSLLVLPTIEQIISEYTANTASRTAAKINLIDIGSGGGFPGIPLAIIFPNLAISLLDSNNKKCAFLRQVAIELELSNVQVIAKRAEDEQQHYHIICSRAFSSLSLMLQLTHHLQSQDPQLPTRWCAMKGKYPEEEIVALESLGNFALKQAIKLQHPTLEVERYAIIISARENRTNMVK